jgi:hypothetical protein
MRRPDDGIPTWYEPTVGKAVLAGIWTGVGYFVFGGKGEEERLVFTLAFFLLPVAIFVIGFKFRRLGTGEAIRMPHSDPRGREFAHAFLRFMCYVAVAFMTVGALAWQGRT